MHGWGERETQGRRVRGGRRFQRKKGIEKGKERKKEGKERKKERKE